MGGAPEAWETWDYATWGRCLEAGERCPYIILITKEVVLSRKRVSLGVGVIGTGVSLQTTGASRVLLRIGVCRATGASRVLLRIGLCRATREHRFLELYTGSLNRGNPHGSPPRLPSSNIIPLTGLSGDYSVVNNQMLNKWFRLCFTALLCHIDAPSKVFIQD